MEITLKVSGMMCEHCVARVKSALEKVEGVEEVKVSKLFKNAKIKGINLDRDSLIKAVTEVGYQAE